MSEKTGDPILRVEGLSKHFRVPAEKGFRRAYAQAVSDVSFDLWPGETLGIVGESGSGKSTLARTLVRLYEPTAGKAWFDGEDIFRMSNHRFSRVRRNLQMVFQDPYASLNPRMKVGEAIMETWRVHRGLVPRSQHQARARELLDRVGLSSDAFDRYPTEFSGGQRQRVSLARALALRPKVIVADEPVSALDVSVQAQVLNLMKDLQAEFGLSYIFIAHDLSIVEYLADRTAVMYLGRIVEEGPTTEIFASPSHPYTQALLSAVPHPAVLEPGPVPERILLTGDLPSPIHPPSGCVFRTRCWKATEKCAVEVPELKRRNELTVLSACHYVEPAVVSSAP